MPWDDFSDHVTTQAVGASFLDSPVDDVRREFETNFYGPLLLARAFRAFFLGHVRTLRMKWEK